MILYRGEDVAMIPEIEMRAIRRVVEGRLRVEPHPFLKCGDRVRVLRGSLEGVEGILARKKNLYRLVLSVDMLAQSVAVEVNAADVEPVVAKGQKANNEAVGTSSPFPSLAQGVRRNLGLVSG
jgi:transcription antitermination factor NusG